MSVLADIQQALELQAKAVLTPLFGVNLAFPNVGFKPTAGTAWAKVDHLPAPTAPAGAGVDSLTVRPGVMQVAVYQPEGQGTAAHLAAAQALNDGFQRGTTLTQNGTQVRILGVSEGPYLRDEAWTYQPVSIRWRCHTVD